MVSLACGDGQSRVRIGDERGVGHGAHLADDHDGAVGAAPAVHADHVGAGGEELARDLGRALAPHGAVAVVQLLVLEEHGGHHRQVGRRLARADGGHAPPAGTSWSRPRRGRRRPRRAPRPARGTSRRTARRCVSPSGSYSTGSRLVGPMEPATNPPGGPTARASRAPFSFSSRGRSPMPYSLSLSAVPPKVFVSTRSRAGRRSSPRWIVADRRRRACRSRARGSPVGEPGGEERGAVAAVEDEAVAGADALDDLPAARAAPSRAPPRRAAPWP